MASPTHRDNLLSPNYKDIGIAVVNGTLNGQKTTLVVQEFGTTQRLAAKPSVIVQGKQIAVPKQDFNKPALIASIPQTKTRLNNNVLVDPYSVSKMAGLTVIALISALLILDVWILNKRGVFRISSHHIAHMALLSLAAGSLIMANPGAIL